MRYRRGVCGERARERVCGVRSINCVRIERRVLLRERERRDVLCCVCVRASVVLWICV